MILDVCFTPVQTARPGRTVCLVIDVLRATSSLATMFARGIEGVLVAETIEEARRLAEAGPGVLLCGEERGLPPEGFDYGNSPVEFDALDLRGSRAVMATTNGTRALAMAAGCRAAYAASMLNVSSAARAAIEAGASDRLDIVAMCAGTGGRFALEDAFCAGAVVEVIEREASDVELADGASAALRVYRSYEGSALEALADASHARLLQSIGLGADVAFCAQRDVFDVAPRLVRDDGVLRLTS
ncbi:MAG: 2-phosphosulfolactate phosphatase [Dehalococcoidia bacterium]